MEYFYVPPQTPNPAPGRHLVIDGDEFNHLTHVMRKQVGDAIRIVDGIGNAYDATIADISKRAAQCMIQAHHHRLHEPSLDVTIAVAVLKSFSNFDFLVEKATELGVNRIVPLRTGRTIPQHAKTDRWQKLALAAMKQSGRCMLPHVHPLTSFSDFMATSQEGLRMIAYEKVASPSLAGVVGNRNETSVVICIGPEGGFTDDEVELAVSSGFVAVSLGERRLRTETAAIVSAGIVLAAGPR